MDIANARYPEDVQASFEHNCLEAQKSEIFYKVVSYTASTVTVLAPPCGRSTLRLLRIPSVPLTRAPVRGHVRRHVRLGGRLHVQRLHRATGSAAIRPPPGEALRLIVGALCFRADVRAGQVVQDPAQQREGQAGGRRILLSDSRIVRRPQMPGTADTIA